MATRPIVLAATMVLALASPARADERFVSPGVMLGVADREENSVVVGAEISAGFVDGSYGKHGEPGGDLRLTWYGAFADIGHDTATGTTRLGLGPELGVFCFGIDASAVTELGGDHARWGVSVRPVITFGWVTFFMRKTRWFDDGPETTTTELGVLLKYVLPPPF